MKSKLWKKTPITIRAACIGGVFVLIAAVLPPACSFVYRQYLASPISIRPMGVLPSVASAHRARCIIKQHFQVADLEMDDHNVVWCDLLGTGSDKEFYAKYRRGFTDYVVVFTTRKDDPENVFFANSKRAMALQGSHVTIGENTYFLCASNAGSGGFLDISVFDYDGIGKLQLIHKEEDIFQGSMYVVDNRIYVAGNNQRYELKVSSGGFELAQYMGRLIPEIGSGSHILAYHILDGRLLIKYDGNLLQFRKHGDFDISKGPALPVSVPFDVITTESLSLENARAFEANGQLLSNAVFDKVAKIGSKHMAKIRQHAIRYVAQSPIILPADEQILLDDNIVDAGPHGIRLLTGLTVCQGFFTTYVPTSPGDEELLISYDYGEWYRIPVRVE